jgi:hypothetical protein
MRLLLSLFYYAVNIRDKKDMSIENFYFFQIKGVKRILYGGNGFGGR